MEIEVEIQMKIEMETQMETSSTSSSNLKQQCYAWTGTLEHANNNNNSIYQDVTMMLLTEITNSCNYDQDDVSNYDYLSSKVSIPIFSFV